MSGDQDRAAEEAARRAEAAAERAEKSAREAAERVELSERHAYLTRNMSTGAEGEKPGRYDDDSEDEDV